MMQVIVTFLAIISVSFAQLTTTVMPVMNCTSCTADSISFTDPTANDTRCYSKTIDNNGYEYYPYYQQCRRLLFNCLIGDVVTIFYYYLYETPAIALNESYIFNYQIEFDCNSNGQWLYENNYVATGVYCSDCGTMCPANSIDIGEPINERYYEEMYQEVLNGCVYQMIGCTSYSSGNYTIVYGDGTNITDGFTNYLTLDCGSNGLWYDTRVNKSVVGFYCSVPGRI
jgi:hypothetical protein